MTTETIKSVFTTPDGQVFDKKADALEHMRRPLIKEALLALCNGKEDAAEWILEKKEMLFDIFDTGTIRRVSKSDAKKLKLSMDAVREISDPRLSFLQENYAAVIDSFRWPAVKRLTAEEKLVEMKRLLGQVTENAEFADWILEKKDDIVESFKAGVVKREVPASARAGLAAYREQMKQKKSESETAAE